MKTKKQKPLRGISKISILHSRPGAPSATVLRVGLLKPTTVISSVHLGTAMLRSWLRSRRGNET